jgi:predicted GNAT family acetyltransferase
MDLDLNKVTVTNNEEAHRFEAIIEGQKAFVNYRRFPDRIVLVHTEVPVEFEGHGLAGKLAKTALDFARTNNLRVVPQCPYITHYLRKHREYQDLVSSDAAR